MRPPIFFLFLMFFSNIAFSQTSVPHTFVSGTPAKASEVNANFQSLATRIDNLDAAMNARLVSLERALSQRLDVLEGKDAAFAVSAMSGTYKLVNIYSGAQQDGGQLFVQSSTSEGILTLNANATYTLVLSEKNSKTRLFVAGDPPQLASSNSVTADGGSINGTWSVADKQLKLSGFPMNYTIAAGNRVLISTVSSDSSPSLLGIDILIRQ